MPITAAITSIEDRTTCVIFGDGAGAVLLEPNAEGLGIIDYVCHVDLGYYTSMPMGV